jgi:uncharacterized Zn finger protein
MPAVMDDIPSLTPKKILSYVGQRSFNLGQQYFASGAIDHTQRERDTIKATCQGTAPRPYRVRITFSRRGIQDSDCSCPVGSGSCKHVAALLIAWQNNPQAFTATLPLDDKLANLDKPQLLSLLKQLLRRNPDLEQIIDATPLPGQPITPQLFRQQADAILATATGEWGEAADLTDQVMDLADSADEFRKSGDLASAGAVYQGLLASLISNHDGFHDGDGEFLDSIGACVEEIGTCIEAIQDQDQRLPLFRALLDVIDFDANLGGMGIGDGAYEIIMQVASPQERREIARWIGNDPRSSDFVMELLASEIPDDEYLDLCRQKGRRHDLIERLLKLNRLDDAARELSSVRDLELPALADLFVSHRQTDLAERCLRERSNRSKSPQILQWLKERCSRRRDYTGALELARRQFQLEPSYENFRQLRTLGRKLKAWESVRPELLALLRKSINSSVLIQVCLEEGLIDEALATLRAQEPNRFAQERLTVAKAAEDSRPEAAIEIYLDEALACIANRHREAYRQACQYLKRARLLYQKAGQDSEWDRQLRTLRTRHKNLRALQGELQKAGMV